MKITQIIHYAEDDSKFERDYYSIVLKDSTGKTIATFGDNYHDSGMERAEGFIAGIAWATENIVELLIEEIADGLGGE